MSRRTFVGALLVGVGHALQSPATAQPNGSSLSAALLDRGVLLGLLATIQPARPQDVAALLQFLASALPTSLIVPPLDSIAGELNSLWTSRFIMKVGDDSTGTYSLTEQGRRSLPGTAADVLDRCRIYLLKGPGRSHRQEQSPNPNDMAPAAPTEPLTLIDRALSPRGHRAEVIARATSFAGMVSGLPGSAGVFPLASYSTIGQLNFAVGRDGSDPPAKIDAAGLALCFGISDRLLRGLAMKGPKRSQFYRAFSLPKSEGGSRRIHAPRNYMKVIQRLIHDYLLPQTPASEYPSAYAFIPGLTSPTIKNALVHRGAPFLLKMDIEDFFGSIGKPEVVAVLRKTNRFTEDAIEMLAHICTFYEINKPRGFLPQGAPTSPRLSNLFLAEFDTTMRERCAARNIAYTRYADDFTFSGSNEQDLLALRQEVRNVLPRPLRINEGKTRILGRGDRQIVTGVVLNDLGLPPRTLRRRVRAMFDQAKNDANIRARDGQKLRGYLNYFRSFDNYPRSELDDYAAILARR